jgi:mRNA interferase RelE/StbE
VNTGPPRRVRVTDAALLDLERLHRKDPQILRDVFAKMILLERGAEAGEPLVGELVGFRRLVVGNRTWRIIWRETTDDEHRPVLDIAEVWAAGAREDSEVYHEMKERVIQLKRGNHPQVHALETIIEHMGRLYRGIQATPEPAPRPTLPDWLAAGLRNELHLPDDRIAELTEQEAQQLMIRHWSRPQD